MIRNKLIVFSLICWVSIFNVKAQDLGEYTKDEVKDFSQKVEDQIRFLEYFLNTVGSQGTSARDKDVIIRDSYSKIFRDEKVQVEDDLLVDRKVITNKDVTAYLKDVEFFFKDAQFKFKVREVKPALRENDALFFIVSLDRTLTAIGLNDEKIENTQPRFIEVNLDKNSNELKIASIYTTKLSRDKELTEWWNNLTFEWSTYFRDKLGFTEDSLTMEQINSISDIDSIVLSGNQIIQDLSPIHALRGLKYVDISNTNIQDLSPISNVTFLSYLDISNTPTDDIQFIKYSDRLTYLDISGTRVADIEELKNLQNLKHLKIINTTLQSFGVLNSFKSLETLDLEECGFSNLENISALENLRALSLKGNYLINFGFLAELKNLETLNLEETNIMDLAPLAELAKLRIVNINGTEVSSLNALDGRESLQKIYADQTSIPEVAADSFAIKNRSILLIHRVEDLQAWWQSLPQGWPEVLSKANPHIQGEPTVEDLYRMVGVDSLDLSGSSVVNLRPVVKFKKLIKLTLDNTKVHDLAPLSELRTLEEIHANSSAVTNVEPLVHLRSLKELHFNGTNIGSVAPLKRLENLIFVDVDQTEVPQGQVLELVEAVPEVNVVFRTTELQAWWESLTDTWRTVFEKQFELGGNPTSAELHAMTASPKLQIEGGQINNLEPLLAFYNLRELNIQNVPLTDMSPLSQLLTLRHLSVMQAPVSGLSPLSSLAELEYLNLSNTGIEDLRPLQSLQSLRTFIASGTNIRNLRGMDALRGLVELDIASTNVRSLNPVMNLSNLESLVCFNTRINRRQVDKFKRANPDCDVRYY